MQRINQLNVFMNGLQVGTLAPYKERQAAFEYSAEWLSEGFSISPFELPLKKGVFISEPIPFAGLFGIFYDSLPDGWGRLLTERMLLKKNIGPASLGILDRLAIVGEKGRGALEYKPAAGLADNYESTDLDTLARECQSILKSEEIENFDRMFALGGSSGGAFPKVLAEINGEDWIVKFRSSHDREDIGKMEYDYTCCAKECGIEVPEVKLFPSELCQGYFGTKRFDRIIQNGEKCKVHMASASALLGVSHRVPALDYNSLMALLWEITRDYGELEKLFRLMCFNIFAHNRDDHSNNFSFIYDSGKWTLSPAYDLTYSSSLGGEHATMVNGNGKNPGIGDIMGVAEKAGLNVSAAMHTASRIRETVNDMLGEYIRPKFTCKLN